LALALALAGCATWQPPHGVDDAALRARAVTQTSQDVRVRATLVDAQTSRAMFGAQIEKANVQPVWIEVENRTRQPLRLLRTGIDPDYFSSLEVAWAMHRTFAGETNASIDDHVESRAFANPIAPGATNTGVVFANPQQGTFLLNLDVFGDKTLVPFTLFLRPDASASPIFEYPSSAITEYRDPAAFRSAVERLPCCASDSDGSGQGDPLNVILVGTIADIGAAGIRRAYRPDLRDYDRTQRVFGRAPDIVARKQAQAGAPATWVRLWVAPMRFDGSPVYVAQVGRPIGGRFAPREADLVLHGDVDEARNLLIQDLMYSGGLEQLGFVTGVGAVTEDAPRTVFNGARYYTDGLRVVLRFASRPLSLSDVEMLDWEPFLERSEAAARERIGDQHD
jgi:hypothetical protein